MIWIRILTKTLNRLFLYKLCVFSAAGEIFINVENPMIGKFDKNNGFSIKNVSLKIALFPNNFFHAKDVKFRKSVPHVTIP